MTIKLSAILLLLAPIVYGGNDKSYVSATGDNFNACTRALPCATWQIAINHTNSGGEVTALDAGDFGSFQLGQPMTIDGAGVATISAMVCAQASAVNGTVIIRNLSCRINSAGAGIGVVNTTLLRLENINIVADGSAHQGIQISTVTAILDNVHVSGFAKINESYGLRVKGSAKVTVTNSSFTNNYIGIDADIVGILQADNVLVQHNVIGVSTNLNGGVTPGGTVRLSDSTITDNTSYGLKPTDNAGAIVGSIISFGNNRIYKNGIDGNFTGAVGLR
jgi:hypothetical protein